MLMCPVNIKSKKNSHGADPHQHLFFWGGETTLTSTLLVGSLSHPVLKHTRAERKTQHLSLFVQCVGISWQSYLLFAFFKFFFIHHKLKLLDEQ